MTFVLNAISVIVPVYNTEKYLHRCVDSILAQTFTDFELLLIDDGSTDSSGAICDEYAQKDSRVRVFHKENGGVSSARNLGLDKAKGKWVTFVDSDDWIKESFLNKLYINEIESVDIVISYANYVGKPNYKNYIEGKYKIELVELLFLHNDLAWQTSPWAKLYKTEICRDIRFKEGMHIGEDLVFLYSYLMKCKYFYVFKLTDYNYLIDDNLTLTRRINKLDEELFSYENISRILNAFVDRFNIREEIVLSKINWIRAYYVQRVLNSMYHNETISQNKRLDVISSIEIEKYVNFIGKDSWKVRFLCFILSKKWYFLYDLVRYVIKILKDKKKY